MSDVRTEETALMPAATVAQTAMTRPGMTDASAGYTAMLEFLMKAGTPGKGALKGVVTYLDAMILVDAGAAFGMSPLAALRAFHVIDGKPVLAADRMAGVVLSHPACLSFHPEVSTSERAVYVCKRRHRDGSIVELRSEWTMDRARKAVGAKEMYSKYPDQMLRARATGELARMAFPDILAGIYVPEEMEVDLGDVKVIMPPDQGRGQGQQRQGNRQGGQDRQDRQGRQGAQQQSHGHQGQDNRQSQGHQGQQQQRKEPHPSLAAAANSEVWIAYMLAADLVPEGQAPLQVLLAMSAPEAENRARALAHRLGRLPNNRDELAVAFEALIEDIGDDAVTDMLTRMGVRNTDGLSDDRFAGLCAAMVRAREKAKGHKSED